MGLSGQRGRDGKPARLLSQSGRRWPVVVVAAAAVVERLLLMSLLTSQSFPGLKTKRSHLLLLLGSGGETLESGRRGVNWQDGSLDFFAAAPGLGW